MECTVQGIQNNLEYIFNELICKYMVKNLPIFNNNDTIFLNEYYLYYNIYFTKNNIIFLCIILNE